MALHTEADGRINAQTALVDLDKRITALETKDAPKPASEPANAKGWTPKPPKAK